ncbi:Aste57867_4340 [Aphanomyces stellatus]|uniref:Aste57867_4340 protein n=1 Tax=Aphanomyces stellatus TaxID=120398 RepID=A0A485KBK9_9STRA|nr:hypothetical protein As57867_004328 [Aphanomyces stellatus]VFT81454.1 Aste57867_4340 [Aphanomyces stellatus]
MGRELCSLCQQTYGSGLEPATGNEIWLARKVFRERWPGNAAIQHGLELFSDQLNDPEAMRQMKTVQVCAFCAQFIVSNSIKDLKKIDDTRHVLLAHSTTRHAHSASLVIQHEAGSSVDADAQVLRYLPNEMNRILTIRPATTGAHVQVNLKRQEQREMRRFTKETQATSREYYTSKLAAMRAARQDSPTKLMHIFPSGELDTARVAARHQAPRRSATPSSPLRPPTPAKPKSAIVVRTIGGGRFKRQEVELTR